MRIRALVENTSDSSEYQKRHGLCIYIEKGQHKILFDLGPDDAFLFNARKMQIDIADIDTVVISHGHADHGGGLKTFLENNDKAKVYVHRRAFEPYFAKLLSAKKYIGLDKDLANNNRIVFTENEYRIDEGLFLFSNVPGKRLLPSNNRVLFAKRDSQLIRDDFVHEQNLLITENSITALFAGCSHSGIVNIMEAAMRHSSSIDYAISGFHMFAPTAKEMEIETTIRQIGDELKKYGTKYMTCHCTGEKPFFIMKEILGEQMSYLSTGMQIDI